MILATVTEIALRFVPRQTPAMVLPAHERKEVFLRIPEDEHLTKIRNTIVNYRGRVATVMKNKPDVSVIGVVISSTYLEEDDCVVLVVEISKESPLTEALFYPKDIRKYYLSKPHGDAHATAKNETGNDCPVTAKLLDLKLY